MVALDYFYFIIALNLRFALLTTIDIIEYEVYSQNYIQFIRILQNWKLEYHFISSKNFIFANSKGYTYDYIDYPIFELFWWIMVDDDRLPLSILR